MNFQSRDGAQPPIEELYRVAKQYSRRQEEVDDLVQDILLEAVKTGRDFSDTRFMAWGRGALRNRAAFVARTEGRRRKREELFHDDHQGHHVARMQLPESFFAELRPSLRIVARLVNCGLNRKEILYLLNIADTALRQRLTALRQAWKAHLAKSGPYLDHRDDSIDALPNGLIRRSLTQAFRQTADRERDLCDRMIGSHDPDGHLFTIRIARAHKKDTLGNTNTDNGE